MDFKGLGRCGNPQNFAGVDSTWCFRTSCALPFPKLRHGICQIRTASDPHFTPDSQIPDSRHETGEFLPKLEHAAVDKTARRPCVQREGVQCETTEADTEQPIAAPAWQFYGTRPSLRDLCVLRTVRAAGRGFRAGTGHSARAGAPWVGFSGLETPRDHATDDMPSPIV